MKPSQASRKLNIAIATSGRFHVLDLARELDALGHKVQFYSYVPWWRARSFGLANHCHVGLLPLVAPLVAWQRFFPDFAPQLLEKSMVLSLDRAAIFRLRPCDVFIFMSGIYLEAARYAKRHFGARVYVERGSRHILSQREILSATAGARVPSDFSVARELASYALADRIVVPSAHAVESFEREPEFARKVFFNPYGVDLNQFPERKVVPPLEPKTVLYVGAWSYRKGVDLLAEAVIQMPGVVLLHVGGVADAPFPDHPRIRHHDSVTQADLARFYAQAHVFALASREDGFGVVLAQALASGLPLVCTDRTGGADLAYTATLAKRIRVVPVGDIDALKEGIESMLDEARSIDLEYPLSDTDRQLLSWQAYGKRYADGLLTET